MRRAWVWIVVAWAACALPGLGDTARASEVAQSFLRDPSISRSHISFSYAGRIWMAKRDGSEVRELTQGGHEGSAALSPDGSQVAFVGRHDGTRAVYVMPETGGEPRRLTFHPADLGSGPVRDALEWSADGTRLLFNSRRTAFIGSGPQLYTSTLFTVSAAGGPVVEVPIGAAAHGSLSPDGTLIAYVPNTQWHWGWKRYRGGQTTPIWIVRLADSRIVAKIPQQQANDFNPLWVGDRIYFLSDRNGPVTLFAYDVTTRQVAQAIRNDGLDIRSAAATSDAIVYEQFGSLRLFDLESGRTRTLDIRVPTDLPELRPHVRRIDPAQLRFADLSPDGRRAVVGVRGEIFVAATAGRDVRNLTRTADAVERDPAWSTDGRFIAFFSDASGEYALRVMAADGSRHPVEINLGAPPAFYYSPTWSPDASKIAYTDQRLNYWYVDLERKAPVRIDTDLYTDPIHARPMVWSPDSRWIAYTKQLPNHFHAVFVYSVERDKSYQLTDGRSDALYAAFDRDGRHLYFAASTDAAFHLGWMDGTSRQQPVTRHIYAIALQKVPGASRSERVDIDFDELSRRTFALSIPARDYHGVVAGRPGELLLIEGPRVSRFDVQTGRMHPLLDEVSAFARGLQQVPAFVLSADAEYMLYFSQGAWRIAATANPTSPRPLALDGLQVRSEPRAEWKHMFEQVWRAQRDFFYDPALHGLDLAAAQKKYRPYLDRIASRDDLNDLFNEMLAQLCAGHLAAFGGDSPVATPSATGLLGADYAVDGDRYRFARILTADTWDPDSRAPLDQPSVDVHAGDYLLAVNGREVRTTADVHGFFANTADQTVVLTIGPTADGASARDVHVVPVADEMALRNFAWREANRRRVAEASDGSLAYLHVPDTGQRGRAAFIRDYFTQVGREGVIVDARYNSGGIGADDLIDLMQRPLRNYWYMRYGTDITAPLGQIFGPKVMITNELTGSGGELLAWQFRRAGLGPLVGKRTWGGLIGIYAFPDDLLDGGTVWTPNLAFYTPAGNWEIENRGVPPDFDVEQDPRAVREGRDPQLEQAIRVAVDLLKAAPSRAAPHHPPYPNYSKSIQQ